METNEYIQALLYPREEYTLYRAIKDIINKQLVRLPILNSISLSKDFIVIDIDDKPRANIYGCIKLPDSNIYAITSVR